MTEAVRQRARVLVVGAGGAIGAGVCRELAKSHDIVALVGSTERAAIGEAHPSVTWQSCEFFSQGDMDRAVACCDYIVYLLHTRVPTARLDQAACEDMDLLIADNVAGAAARHGTGQIIYFGGTVPDAGIDAAAAARRREVARTLTFHGTPVTVLRAGLVVAPGSNTIRLLASLAVRLPVMLVPTWTLRPRQPIAVQDVARGIMFCLGNEAAFGQEYSIGGPTVLGHRELLERTARALGRRPLLVTVSWFPRRAYRWYLRLLDPATHPALIKLAVENLSADTTAGDNLIQRLVAAGAVNPSELVAARSDPKDGRLPDNPRAPVISRYRALLKSRRSVRSIQRVELPAGRNAAWVAIHYFQWLPRFAWPFVACEMDPQGSCSIMSRMPPLRLLELTFAPAESSPNCRIYHVTGGLLARRQAAGKPRLEFRDVLGGSCTIIAIHDFAPRLPWFTYRATQAVIHLGVMRAFQRHMRTLVA